MSFKIKINNEEVVSDSNLQIKEEMLSTSSTILKNCYPKSWEDDKDYTTKYYFPKDYSKCKIVDETYHPESLGTRVTGTNLHINYDNNKNWDLEELQGNTYQQTYTGKNLFNKFKSASSTNGASLTQINNGIKVSVTVAGANKYVALKLDNPDNLLGKTLTISGNIAKSGSNDALIRFYFTNGNTLISNIANTIYQTGKSTFTVPASYPTNCNGISIVFSATASNSGSVGNYVNYTNVQLEVGSTQTSYEPYVGGVPSPNPDYPQAIQNVTGRQTIDVVGKNLFNGELELGYYNDNGVKTNSNTNYRNKNIIAVNPNTTYTFSINGTSQKYVVYYYNESQAFINVEGLTTGTFTTPSNCNYLNFRCFNADFTNDYVNLKVQLEKGSTATTYEEYIGQSYEINLGKNLVQSKEINSTTSNYATVLFVEADLKPNTTYTISYDGTPNNKLYTNENLFEQVTFTNISGRTKVTTTTKSTISKSNTNQYESGKGWKILKNGTSGAVGGANVFNDLQLEEGSQATSYSEYFTPIELNKIGNYQDSIKKSTGKNLFDKNNVTNGKRFGSDGAEIDDVLSFISDYIKVKSSTSYTANYTIDWSTRIVQYDSSKNIINVNTSTSTFTTLSNTEYIRITRRITDKDTTMINEGSTALPYEPYLPIDTWYIEKKIGKVVLNGTESYTFEVATNFSNTGKTRFTIYQIPTDYNSATAQIPAVFNIAINSPTTSYAQYNNAILMRYVSGQQTRLDLMSNTLNITTVADFKNWLGNNNLITYYQLNTPTYTEITNTDLINQLESIELLNGINNIMVSSGDLAGAIQIFYNYKEAYITEDIIFCGCVKNTGNISLNPREPHYVDLQVLDFKTLLSEGETLNYVITGKTITEAINQVVASISDYGFVVGNIELLNPNDIINAYSTLNKTAYDVFQYIADITQSKWTTRLIDENTIAIDFYDPTLMPQAEPILNTKEYMCSHKINDISFNYSTNDYRNKQIMTSDEVFANITQTETLTADGYSKNFICQNKIGKITSITVNGVESSFVTKSEDELGLSGDFVYQPGENQFTSKNTISSGAIIVITYYAIVKGREIILNSTESSRISNQIGRKGTISRYENRNDTTSSLELQKIGQSYIKYKGNAEITLKVISENNLFNVGQIVNYDAPLNELKTDYMVKTKVMDMYLNANKIFYSYELSNNFNSENAINYFDNQRAKNQGNIGEGETITRNIDIETTSSIIFYETNIEEVEVSNPTSLDFALDGVLI